MFYFLIQQLQWLDKKDRLKNNLVYTVLSELNNKTWEHCFTWQDAKWSSFASLFQIEKKANSDRN